MGGPKLAWLVPIVTAMFVETERPFLASVYFMLIVPEPLKPVVGVNLRPFSHALRLVNVPLIVIDAELFAPETNVIPVVDPSLRLPRVAVSTTCSMSVLALTSAILIALFEKVSVPFWGTVPVVGAVRVGAITLTLSATFVKADWPLGSETFMASESDPEKFLVGV